MKGTTRFDDSCFARLDFPLLVERQAAHPPYPPHSHTYEELVLIESGTVDHFVNTKEWFTLMAGNVFVIKPDSNHGYINPQALTLVNIRFHLHRLALPLAAMRQMPGYHALFNLEPKYRAKPRFDSRLRLGMTDMKHALDLASKIMQEMSRREPGYEFASLSNFMCLIAFLCRCYSQSTIPHIQPLLQVDSAIQHLESNYREPVSIRSLADQTHRSISSLLRDFKFATGQTPIQYLLALRLRKAADILLERPDLNVTDAALAVGFNDSNYFSRQFKKHFKVSPKAFKRHPKTELPGAYGSTHKLAQPA
jgi:AraC-like DNA-binding protein